MEDDVLGEQRVLGHVEYATCARCEAPIPVRSPVLVPGDALEDHSEYTYLCEECQRALANGEKDLPTTTT